MSISDTRRPLLIDPDEYDAWLDHFGHPPPKIPEHHFRPPIIRLLTQEEREAKAQARAEWEQGHPPTQVPRRSSLQSVYLMSCDGGMKIGIATNVDRRLATIQAMNPLPLSVIHSRAAPFPQHLERYLHKTFEECRIRGEWFNLSDDQVTEAIGIIDTWDGK